MTPEQWATYQGIYDHLVLGTVHLGPLTVDVSRTWRPWRPDFPLAGRIRDYGGLPGLTLMWAGPVRFWWSTIKTRRVDA